MATKDQIKAALLKAAGNPSTGIIRDLADDFAQAVWELDNTNANNPAKEVRVVDAKETR
jgi:hypothetical protein